MNILVLTAGRRIELVEAFKKAFILENIGGKVIAADMKSSEFVATSYFADHYVQIKPILDPDYIEDIIQICNKYEVKLIIPGIDKELRIIARNKNRIEAFTDAIVMISDENGIDLCENKFLTHEFLTKYNLKTPRLINEDDLLSKNYHFPLFIKPSSGSSSFNCFKIHNEPELLFFKTYVKDPIIQEFVFGTEYCIDIFSDFEGNPITIVPKIRISHREGEIVDGKIEKHPGIISLMKKLVLVLKPKGEINVDCIVSGSEIYIIEINPRFGGGAPMSFKSGANSPLNLIKLLKGETLKYNEDYQDGLFFMRFEDCIHN